MTFSIPGVAACGNQEAPPRPKETDGSQTEKSEGPPPVKEAVAHVPVGKFLAGSNPGEPGRDPALEPLEGELDLGPFRIDVLPYPGDPQAPARVGVAPGEANALCAARGGRLCTEVEWERACRGPSSSLYPPGNEPCTPDKGRCQSAFDVAQMTTLLEWTASHFGRESDEKGKVVVRGAPASLPADERRCARRTALEKDEANEVGFRCCYGAPNATSLSEPKLGPPYEEVDVTPADLKKLLAESPVTAPLAKDDVILFKPEASTTVLSRGPGDTMGFTLTTRALKWQPDRGSRYLVVAGRSGKKTSFVLAYHLAGQKKSLAGSFIMENEPGPVALGYADSIRPRVHFSSCWGCPGETGKVLFRPPEELVLLQP